MSYRQMVDRRAKLVAEATELYIAAEAAGKNAWDNERYKAIRAEVAELTPAIAAEDKRRDAELERLSNEGNLVSYNPMTGKMESPKPSRARGATFTQMFGSSAARDAGRFEDPTDFYRALLFRDRMRFDAAVFGDRDGDGAGYLVPGQFVSTIWDAALGLEVVRPRARLFAMQSDTLAIAGIGHFDGSGGNAFGIQHKWGIAPASQLAGQEPTVKAMLLHAEKIGALVNVPNEIVSDAVNFPDQMTQILARGLAWSLDKGFLTGTGVAEPTGAFNEANPALIVVSKETAQTAATVVGANVAKMLARLPASSYPTACWVMSPSVVGSLLQQTLVSGAIAPILQTGTQPGSYTMMGLPAFVSEHMAELGSQGDIGLADFNAYAVGLRQDISVQFSTDVFFDYDMTAFRSIARGDGLPMWPGGPYTPSGGTTTLSPFVVLEARS